MTNNDHNQFRKIIREEVTGIVDEKISASEKRVIGEVGEFVTDHLLPLIDNLAEKSDIDRIERKVDRLLDTSLDHEGRIKAIEYVPVVAHHLKLK